MKSISKLLALAILVTLTSCGKDNRGEPYLFETNLNRSWASVDGKLTSIDLTNLSNITVAGLSREGITSICTYSATQTVGNGFSGGLNFTYVSGDSFVCSQLVGNNGYTAVNNTKTGKDEMSLRTKIGSFKFE